ncbi:hypothetical protein ACUTQ5_15755 [Serratia sp. NA_112.1]|uniref:hypothetical protein n=1 Tax=Serratia sp. NA_112.1 TaxID=3415665 RepID=UPI004046BF9C
MKNKVFISLNEHNSYFLTGLHALIEYFTDIRTQVDFFSGYSSKKPNIIFQALYQGKKTDICRRLPADAPQPLYFVIRDKAERQFTPPSSTLYRNQNIDDILGMVKLAMQLNCSTTKKGAVLPSLPSPKPERTGTPGFVLFAARNEPVSGGVYSATESENRALT